MSTLNTFYAVKFPSGRISRHLFNQETNAKRRARKFGGTVVTVAICGVSVSVGAPL